MKTEWVRVCVRPEQSFTRAILEIYMADGGTLGDVITALRKQKQFRIIQVTKISRHSLSKIFENAAFTGDQ